MRRPAKTAVVAFAMLLLGGLMVIVPYGDGGSAAHAQQDGGTEPGPPGPPPHPPEPDPPFDPDSCIDLFGVYTCPGMEEIETNDYTRTIDGVCTGDEGNDGAMLHTCGFAAEDVEPQEDDPDDPDLEPEPDPDPEEPTPPISVTEITRTEDYACDAPEPALDLPSVDFPDHSLSANPPGAGGQFGVTGMDIWVWADGDDQYMWAETEFGEEGFTVYARDGLYYPDDDSIEWGGEYVYELARWQCANYAFWYAEIVEWRWTLNGPDTIVGSGGQAGSEPNPHGDGMNASAHLPVETKGNYTLTLETVWNGSWGDTWTTTHGPTDYEVREVVPRMRERQ